MRLMIGILMMWSNISLALDLQAEIDRIEKVNKEIVLSFDEDNVDQQIDQLKLELLTISKGEDHGLKMDESKAKD